MNSYFKFIVTLLLLSPTLAGCKENLSYNYLIEHPLELKQAVDRCQTQANRMGDAAVECDMVMKAADKVMTTLNEQQADPEKFGEKIMATEIACINAKIELEKSRQALADLKTKNAPAADIKTAEEKIQLANKAYQDKRDEKKAMLAIVGLSSPE